MPRVKKPKPEGEQAAIKTSEKVAEKPAETGVPTLIRKHLESQDHQPAAQPPREFDENNELTGVNKIQSQDSHIHGGELERIGFDANGNRIRGKKWHEEMAFANEMVTVRVHETTDKNAHPLPDVYVNGRVQRFPRGQEIQVRRCFVERLARAVATSYGNTKVIGEDGEEKYLYPPASAEVYPFTVIGDTPKGEAWLKSILRERQ